MKKKSIKKKSTNWFAKHWKYVMLGTVGIIICGSVMIVLEQQREANKIMPNATAPLVDMPEPYVETYINESNNNPVEYVSDLDVSLNATLNQPVKDISFDVMLNRLVYAQEDEDVKTVVNSDNPCIALKYTVTYKQDMAFDNTYFFKPFVIDGMHSYDMQSLIKEGNTWVDVNSIVFETNCSVSNLGISTFLFTLMILP